MTQEELAESAEISLSHLSKVESGSRMIGMKTYSKILYALNAVPIMITETEKSEIHSDLVLRLLSILKECSEVEVEFLLNTVETIKNNMDIIRNHEKVVLGIIREIHIIIIQHMKPEELFKLQVDGAVAK
ncbi:MAG: helix-turn-helix domain-containing protein [Eisenbergiella massiliensis]